MKTVKEYLDKEWEENSGHITKKAILNTACDRVGSYQTYADIEGIYMAVYSYWEHNIEDMNVVENEKYYGYELFVDLDRTEWLIRNYGKGTVQLVIPKWVMRANVNSETHATNMFKKYLRIV